MLIKKGYVVPTNPAIIYKSTNDIKKLVDEGKLNIEFSAENYQTKFYATFNDGEILVSPLNTFEEVMEECKRIQTAMWDSERKIIIDFENNDIADFYNAYTYLINHPIFAENFSKCLDIEVVKVNPATLQIDDKPELNTKTQVWLECGPYIENESTHDIDLDCGDDTFETAIIELAELVRKHYGDDKICALNKVNEKYN